MIAPGPVGWMEVVGYKAEELKSAAPFPGSCLNYRLREEPGSIHDTVRLPHDLGNITTGDRRSENGIWTPLETICHIFAQKGTLIKYNHSD